MTRTEGQSTECKIPCGFDGCIWYYRTQRHRDEHYTTHFKEKTLPCDECNLFFKSKTSVSLHKASAHVKPESAIYKCPVRRCGRLFSLRQPYSRHLATHDDQRRYVCRVCHKGFKNDRNLNGHVRIHRELVTCKYCERLYSSHNVKSHEARHERKNNYFCELCQVDCQSLTERFDHNQSEGHKSLLGYSELSPIAVSDVNLMKDEIIIIPCGPDDYPRFKKCDKANCWTCERGINAKAVIFNGHIFEINQTLTCSSSHVLYLWSLKDSPTLTKLEKRIRYLGQANDIRERMAQYKSKNEKKIMGSRVKKAFHQYYDDFQLVVLTSTHKDVDALNDGEMAFIDVWDCTNDLTGGLNFLRGGIGQYNIWLDKITKSNK